ncbi:hypothetical protein [Nocardia niigatensis]
MSRCVQARRRSSTTAVESDDSKSPLGGGKTLRHPVDVLLGWADKHMPEIEYTRTRFDESDLA